MEAGLQQQLAKRRAFVMHALLHMGDAEIAGAAQYDRRLARADDRGGDARLLQQLDAVAVEHVEALDDFAVGAKMQPAIGQHAVDIENHQLDPRRALRRQLELVLVGVHQMTLARVRS